MNENPFYEQRRNLDRQAGLALETSGKKRKHDDKSSKDKEEKTKHKKEKKDKDKIEEDSALHKEEKLKVKNEEEVNKSKLCRKEDFKKSQEQERYSYSKKDEDDKYKHSKRDDKYCYSRDDEDRNIRYKNSNRDEEYRYSYRKDEDRYNEPPKYSPRDNEDKYKHEKYSDNRSKYSKEHDERKPQAEMGTDKPSRNSEKPDHSNSEPPLKPYELPKIFCGPSPAMRAKLRKQSLEAGKAPAATTSFGKFTWKKKENQLAKEAQKIAAEFLKEEEMDTKEQESAAEDSFAKCLVIAQEISSKLAGEPLMPPAWYKRGRGKIRPDLRAPTNQVRRAVMAGKPASLNTFLNLRSPNTSILGPAPGSLVRLPLAQTILFPSVHIAPGVTKSEPFGPKLPPSMSKPELSKVNTTHGEPKLDSTESKALSSKAKQDLQVSKPAIESRPPPVEFRPPPVGFRPPPVGFRPPPVGFRPPPVGFRPPPVESRPPPVESRPPPVESRPSPVESKLPPILVNSAPTVSSPIQSKVTSETKPVPAEGKPESCQDALSKYPPAEPAMIKIVSDVAAPGVPESEQTCTVFVKPPPFINKTLGPHKPDKVKNNLAAAKAQDLIGIFYSSSSQQGPSSLPRPETCDKSIFIASEAPQRQPQPGFQAQPQSKIEIQPQDKSQSQTQDQLLSKPQNESKPQPELQNQSISFTQSLTEVKTSPETDLKICPPDPQIQTESDIQITSVWSLQHTNSQMTQVVPTIQPKSSLGDCDQSSSVNQAPNQEPIPESQPKPAPHFEAEALPESLPQPAPHFQAEDQPESLPQPAPYFQAEAQAESLPNPETALSPQSKLKPGPKTRGKSTPTRKTPPASAPTRQTRSQTRYQTRQQQQSQTDPEPALGDHDSTTSDSKGFNVSDPESQPKAETTIKMDAAAMETTPETLGLPSDMTSQIFGYDFNFE